MKWRTLIILVSILTVLAYGFYSFQHLCMNLLARLILDKESGSSPII